MVSPLGFKSSSYLVCLLGKLAFFHGFLQFFRRQIAEDDFYMCHVIPLLEGANCTLVQGNMCLIRCSLFAAPLGLVKKLA